MAVVNGISLPDDTGVSPGTVSAVNDLLSLINTGGEETAAAFLASLLEGGATAGNLVDLIYVGASVVAAEEAKLGTTRLSQTIPLALQVVASLNNRLPQ